MQGRRSDEREARRERSPLGAGVFVAQPRLYARQRFRFVLAVGNVDAGPRPARGVERDEPRLDDPPIGDGDAHRALGAGLADIAPLNIAGIDDPGIAADFLGRVDMAQRPIIIAEALEILDAAGGIGFMAARTVERGVQQADIEPALAPRRIGRDEVRIDQPPRKASAVQRDAQGLDLEGSRVARGKNPRALGIGQRLRHQAFGVVIALDDVSGDSRALQTPQLARRKTGRSSHPSSRRRKYRRKSTGKRPSRRWSRRSAPRPRAAPPARSAPRRRRPCSQGRRADCRCGDRRRERR